MTPIADSHMVYFEIKPDYLYARVESPLIDRSMAYGYLAEIVFKCAELRQKKLLLERNTPAETNDDDMFAAMSDLVRMSQGMRIAFVNGHIPKGELPKHAATVEGIQGADYKCFTDPAEAEKWLLESD